MSTTIKLILKLFLFIGIATYAQEKTDYDDIQYIELLENSLKNEVTNKESKNLLFKESRIYWNKRKLDYNLHPEKYETAISLFHKNQQKFKEQNDSVDAKRKNRIENAVKDFQNFDDKNTFAENAVLFVGSSSIAGWKTSLSFPEYFVINRGIGGMNMREIIYNYDILIKKYSPSIIAIYCDIDIEQGESPYEVITLFKKLINKIKTDLPKTSILLLSMKPVMIDDFIGKDIRKNKTTINKQFLKLSTEEEHINFVDLASPMLNPNGKLKTEIFIEDGMHLNELGYKIWNQTIRPIITNLSINLSSPKTN
jgi:hypothetical protein